MALVIGTNSGFCETAPVVDPSGGTSSTPSERLHLTHDTSPATAVRVTEIGWWHTTAGNTPAYSVGLYAADGATVPGEAGTLLFSSTGHTTGSSTGWEVVSGLDWTISPNTPYWLAVWKGSTVSATSIDIATSGGSGIDSIFTSGLDNPAGGGALADVDGMYGIYAVVETSGPTYTIAADAGSFALTGQTMSPIVSRLIAMGTGAYTLSGQVAALLRTFVMTMGTGVYNLTGNALDFVTTGWKYATKAVASFGNDTKHTSTFTSETKHTANYGSETKNTATYASPTKNTPTWSNEVKN